MCSNCTTFERLWRRQSGDEQRVMSKLDYMFAVGAIQATEEVQPDRTFMRSDHAALIGTFKLTIQTDCNRQVHEAVEIQGLERRIWAQSTQCLDLLHESLMDVSKDDTEKFPYVELEKAVRFPLRAPNKATTFV